MAINVADNFSYKGGKPLDARTKYTAVADMVATPAADLYDGCLAYVTATKKNYQYDSSNTSDPTFGKWRELQTGGGGGTDYTAGDGIDITNNVISTKQSEEGDIDEIVDVYPQAGNLVSIVNAFNKGDIYNTEERMIGQWVDGKPLYQKYVEYTQEPLIINSEASSVSPRTIYTKTFTELFSLKFTEIHCNTNTSYNEGYIAFKKNSEEILKFTLTSDVDTYYADSFGNHKEFICSFNANDVFSIEVGWSGSHSGCYFNFGANVVEIKNDDPIEFLFEKIPYVLNYTKTTDVPISIGEATEYSTTEKVVGTWIDGKPLYAKTFYISSLPNNTTADYTLDVSNVEYIAEVTGVARVYDSVTNENIIRPLPYIASSYIGLWTDTKNGVTVATISANSDRSNHEAYITLKYTKTTN